jgi:hypothetical protein
MDHHYESWLRPSGLTLVSTKGGGSADEEILPRTFDYCIEEG